MVYLDMSCSIMCDAENYTFSGHCCSILLFNPLANQQDLSWTDSHHHSKPHRTSEVFCESRKTEAQAVSQCGKKMTRKKNIPITAHICNINKKGKFSLCETEADVCIPLHNHITQPAELQAQCCINEKHWG